MFFHTTKDLIETFIKNRNYFEILIKSETNLTIIYKDTKTGTKLMIYPKRKILASIVRIP